jgi:hypothetical protein
MLGPVQPSVFETFLKFLYFGELPSGNFSVQEALFLYECTEFYGLKNSSLKMLAEGKIRKGLDKPTVLETLDLAHKL